MKKIIKPSESEIKAACSLPRPSTLQLLGSGVSWCSQGSLILKFEGHLGVKDLSGSGERKGGGGEMKAAVRKVGRASVSQTVSAQDFVFGI